MTVTATSPDKLPQYNGLPVPWITRWTGEFVKESVKVAVDDNGQTYVMYPDEKYESREVRGVLWMREGIARGGEPQWASVNTFRQRAAMAKCICQVCGTRINDRPIRWLIPTALLKIDDEGVRTTSAPTCEACIPLALELCPYMKKHGYQILKVLEYEVWGVQGEAILPDPEDHTRVRHLGSTFWLSYDKPRISFGHIVAKQSVVALTKYSVEEVQHVR